MTSLVRGGRVAIKVNDQIGLYFKSFKGLRQGDPLSPLLFYLVADGSAVFVQKSCKKGLIKGLAAHLVDGGVPILQYADDTFFLLEDDVESVENLKIVLYLFEQLSGLKTNFHKNE